MCTGLSAALLTALSIVPIMARPTQLSLCLLGLVSLLPVSQAQDVKVEMKNFDNCVAMTMMTLGRLLYILCSVPARGGGPPGLPAQRAEQERGHGAGHLQGIPGRWQGVRLKPGRAVNEHS